MLSCDIHRQIKIEFEIIIYRFIIFSIHPSVYTLFPFSDISTNSAILTISAMHPLYLLHLLYQLFFLSIIFPLIFVPSLCNTLYLIKFAICAILFYFSLFLWFQFETETFEVRSHRWDRDLFYCVDSRDHVSLFDPQVVVRCQFVQPFPKLSPVSGINIFF